MAAAKATVLGKADATVGDELASFNLADRGFDETAEFPALIFRD